MTVAYPEPPYKSVMTPRIGRIMQVPAGYWANSENVRENLDWLIEKEQIPFGELPRRISVPLLQKNGLNGLVSYYHGSTFRITDIAYPRQFRIWQFRHNGNRIWTNEDGTPNYELCRQATKWLVEEKLGLHPFYSGTLMQEDFYEHGLSGMLYLVYHGSPRKAVDDGYPGIKALGKKLPQGFWQSEKGLVAAIRAVQRLVKRRRIPERDIPKRLTFDLFREDNLETIVNAVPSRSHIDLIIAAYPKFKPSDFPRYRGQRLHSKEPTELEMLLSEYRIREDGSVIDLYSDEGKEVALGMVRELMQREGISEEEAPTRLTKDLFKKHGLIPVYNTLGRNTYKVVTSLLPEEELRPWQIKPVPDGYWNGPEGLEHAKQATRWLVEEKLKISIEEIPERIYQQTFIEYGLNGMLHLFNGSVYGAVNNAYKGRFKEWKIRQKNMWQGKKGNELGKKAVMWLVEYLEISIEDVPSKLRRRHLKENDLGGCLDKCFNKSLYNAISETFPEVPKEQLAWMRKKSEHLTKH